MVGGGGVEFAGEEAGVVAGELVGVDAQCEAQGLRGLQYAARLFDGEDVGFAEDVASFGERLAGDCGEHLLDHEIDVGVDAAAEFIGDLVGAEEGGDIAQAGFGVEGADGAEDFEFRVQGEAVAALGFERGGAAAQEPLLVAAGGREQGVGRRLAGEAHGGAYAAPGGGDLGVRGAGDAALEFGGAGAGEDGVGVGIHEAR